MHFTQRTGLGTHDMSKDLRKECMWWVELPVLLYVFVADSSAGITSCYICILDHKKGAVGSLTQNLQKLNVGVLQ